MNISIVCVVSSQLIPLIAKIIITMLIRDTSIFEIPVISYQMLIMDKARRKLTFFILFEINHPSYKAVRKKRESVFNTSPSGGLKSIGSIDTHLVIIDEHHHKERNHNLVST